MYIYINIIKLFFNGITIKMILILFKTGALFYFGIFGDCLSYLMISSALSEIISEQGLDKLNLLLEVSKTIIIN